MIDRKYIEQRVLAMEHPKDPTQFIKQLDVLVNFFYDNVVEYDMPMIPVLRAMLGDNGPIHTVCGRFSQKWGGVTTFEETAALAIGAIGISAAKREQAYVARNWGTKSVPSKAWLAQEVKELSFLAVAAAQEKQGLGCGCAFCSAVYIGANYNPLDNDGLKGLWRNLEAVEGSQVEWCCSNIVDALIEQYDWPDCRCVNLGEEDQNETTD